MLVEKLSPFRNQYKVADHRGEVDISQRQVIATQVLPLASDPLQRPEYSCRCVEALLYLVLVRRLAHAGPENPVREDLSHKWPVGIAVHDRHYLVAAHSFFWLRSLKLRAFKALIHVARNGACLVNGERAVNQRGHAPKGMRSEVTCRHILGERIYLYPVLRLRFYSSSSRPTCSTTSTSRRCRSRRYRACQTPKVARAICVGISRRRGPPTATRTMSDQRTVCGSSAALDIPLCQPARRYRSAESIGYAITWPARTPAQRSNPSNSAPSSKANAKGCGSAVGCTCTIPPTPR